MQKKEAIRKEQIKNPKRRKNQSKEFKVGDKVSVQCEKSKKWLFQGTITEQVEEDSYKVRLKKPSESHEKIYLQNRSMLKEPIHDQDSNDQIEDHDNSDTTSEGISNTKMRLRSSSRAALCSTSSNGGICGS